MARSKVEPSLQTTLLCIELIELAKFARAPAPNATLTLPLPKHDTDPLVAFAAIH
jgi:hypothetical protein